MAAGKLLPRTCARCGAPFGCGAEAASCWCATVDVPPDVVRTLNQGYDGCLCPECLRAAGDINTPSLAPRSA
jgi:hypothetical protein